MKFAQRVFLIAGIYGLLALVPNYFLENKNSQDFPPAITHPEYYYGFIGVAVAWQILFIIMSRDPYRYRPVIIPAIVEKFSFGIAAVILLVLQRVHPLVTFFGSIDMMLGLLFIISYFKLSEQNRSL